MTDFGAAKTKTRTNGQDHIAAIRADLHNTTEWVRESQAALEKRMDAKLDEINRKLDSALNLLSLIGEHAKHLAKD